MTPATQAAAYLDLIASAAASLPVVGAWIALGAKGGSIIARAVADRSRPAAELRADALLALDELVRAAFDLRARVDADDAVALDETVTP